MELCRGGGQASYAGLKELLQTCCPTALTQRMREDPLPDLAAMFDALCHGPPEVNAHVDSRKPVFRCGLGETREETIRWRRIVARAPCGKSRAAGAKRDSYVTEESFQHLRRRASLDAVCRIVVGARWSGH